MKTNAKAAVLAAVVFGVALGARAGEAAPSYLTFTAKEAGSTVQLGWSAAERVEVNTNGMWVSYEKNAMVTLANIGDKVRFRGKNVISAEDQTQHFRMTGALAASGSVTSLIDENGGDPYVALPEKCFYHLFDSCTNLTVAPKLPSLNLTNGCYSAMFTKTWLTRTPKLPATVLKETCYANMFAYCKYLTNPASVDHVTSVAKNCCRQMYMQCENMKVYTDSTHEGYTRAWKATSAVEGADDWSYEMFPQTEGGLQGTPTVGETYYVANGVDYVTITIPALQGATAELFLFDTNGGWASTEIDEVPSNTALRVVWTAEAEKTLTAEDAVNVYAWQKTFVADKAEQTAPAPTIGTEGESEVSIGLDTRTKKSYFNPAEILPVWYAAAADVEVQGQGQEPTTLVSLAAQTNTLHWTPTAQDVYTLTQTGLASATITLSLPVEVTTNGLEIAKTSAVVTDDVGQPLAAQTEGEFADKLIVPSNSMVRVVYTVTEPGLYFVDGSTTYVATFTADKSMNDAATMIAAQKPAVPAAPNVKVGVAAQRYPWNGMIDVRYKVANTPSGAYKLKVMADCGGVVASATVDNVKSGTGTAVIQAKGLKEMKSKKCRVYATLQKATN